MALSKKVRESRREAILKSIEELKSLGTETALQLAASMEKDYEDSETVLGWWAGKREAR